VAQNNYLDFVFKEFDVHGITNYKRVSGTGKHDRVVWSHHGRSGELVVAKTPSDHRTPLNLRSDLRRQLQAANISKPNRELGRKPLKNSRKPDPSELLERKVSSLVSEVDTVTDMLLEIAPDLNRFNRLAEQASAIADNSSVKFRIRADIPPAIVGGLLAYLVANDVAMTDIRVAPLKPEAAVLPAEPLRTAPVPLPAPVTAPVCISPASPALFARPPAPLTKPAPLNKLVRRCGGKRAFAGSAMSKLMLYLRDHGAQTEHQLERAGLQGYAGTSSPIANLCYALIYKGFGIRNRDGTVALTPAGEERLKQTPA
jgi:hypothetical protein